MAASLKIAFTVAPKEQKGVISGLNLLLTIGIADFIYVAISQSFEFLFPKESSGLDPAEIYATSEIWFPKEDDTTSLESNNRTEEYANSEMGLFFSYCFLAYNYLVLLIPNVSNWVERVRREAAKAEAVEASTMIEKPESLSTMNANVIGSSSFNEVSAAGEGDHS
jgi:hypothetical protein